MLRREVSEYETMLGKAAVSGLVLDQGLVLDDGRADQEKCLTSQPVSDVV
jgi:hypothetical protein